MYTESICGIKKVYFSDRMSLGDKLADSIWKRCDTGMSQAFLNDGGSGNGSQATGVGLAAFL